VSPCLAAGAGVRRGRFPLSCVASRLNVSPDQFWFISCREALCPEPYRRFLAGGVPACRSLRLGGGPKVWVMDFLFIMLLQFPRPYHVLRPRDRYRTITPLLLFGVLPEPVHAALSDAEISTIAHFACVPGKELPQEAPSNPVPVCPPPALADFHDAHSHACASFMRATNTQSAYYSGPA
jgi:hypothetical protein